MIMPRVGTEKKIFANNVKRAREVSKHVNRSKM